jgi:hypothetical protein
MQSFRRFSRPPRASPDASPLYFLLVGDTAQAPGPTLVAEAADANDPCVVPAPLEPLLDATWPTSGKARYVMRRVHALYTLAVTCRHASHFLKRERLCATVKSARVELRAAAYRCLADVYNVFECIRVSPTVYMADLEIALYHALVGVRDPRIVDAALARKMINQESLLADPGNPVPADMAHWCFFSRQGRHEFDAADDALVSACIGALLFTHRHYALPLLRAMGQHPRLRGNMATALRTHVFRTKEDTVFPDTLRAVLALTSYFTPDNAWDTMRCAFDEFCH